ncbi:MAG: hypothetical protein [Wendovervirus sonii]|uniref:Uncharacterized protein n=1 Tax=phage Lak_Megaphage_Sonny TaxID=3109229 RepID=A0ABZ0Z568_9CAUD|nr:MAG: hypothetical protein [phage Lak_Megaphage_Sonny]
MIAQRLHESIMTNISYRLRTMLNESDNGLYTITYRKPMYFINSDDEKISLIDTKIDPKYIEFNENDLDKYLDDNIINMNFYVHINDPYNEFGYICFDIESTVPFDTEISGYGPHCTLKKALFNYLDGQLSDGWGENGVGDIIIRNKKYTLFA